MTASVGPSPKVRKLVEAPAGCRRCWPGDLLVGQQLARSRPCRRDRRSWWCRRPSARSGLWPVCCSRRSIMICTRLPDMQDWRGGVEADIGDDAFLLGELIQRRAVGALMQESAVDDLAQKTGFELARHSHLTPVLKGAGGVTQPPVRDNSGHAEARSRKSRFKPPMNADKRRCGEIGQAPFSVRVSNGDVCALRAAPKAGFKQSWGILLSRNRRLSAVRACYCFAAPPKPPAVLLLAIASPAADLA